MSVCQTDPIEFVEDMCENMQLFPKEDLLTGDQLMFEFRPEVTVCVCMRVCISGFLTARLIIVFELIINVINVFIWFFF